MKEYRLILQRVGTTLILLGAVHVFLMIWEDAATSSSGIDDDSGTFFTGVLLAALWEGLFYTGIGILLFRGGLKTAKYLRCFALLWFVGAIASPLMALADSPIGYYFALLHLSPGAASLWYWSGLVDLAFYFWLQYELGHREIMDAQIDARITPPPTRPVLLFGVVMSLFAGTALYAELHGGSARNAIETVKKHDGDQYVYFARKIHWSLEPSEIDTTVVVTGYNAEDIRDVILHWKDIDPTPDN